jgi:hypothetical protein
MPGFEDIRTAAIFRFNDSFELAFSSDLEVISIQHHDRSFPQSISLSISDLQSTSAAHSGFWRRRQTPGANGEQSQSSHDRESSRFEVVTRVLHRNSFCVSRSDVL